MKFPKMSHLKPTYALKMQLRKVIFEAISRIDKHEDAVALLHEVQRGYVYHIISEEDFLEMSKQLEEVINELKTKEENEQ